MSNFRYLFQTNLATTLMKSHFFFILLKEKFFQFWEVLVPLMVDMAVYCPNILPILVLIEIRIWIETKL